MDEKLYAIPVREAFENPGECPLCRMRKTLEDASIAYTLGASYMEDDVRMETNRQGFCRTHLQVLSMQENKLGLALILKTHFDRVNQESKKRIKTPGKKGGLFSREKEDTLVTYLEEQQKSCFICSRVNNTFARYVDTTIYLYKKEAEFRQMYGECRGFCMAHTADLLRKGKDMLGEEAYRGFYEVTTRLYIDNMERVTADLDWFTNKFDYRYKDAPWKEAKDAIPRALVKLSSIPRE